MSKQKDLIVVQMALFFLSPIKVHSLQKRKIASRKGMNEDFPEPHQEMLMHRVCWLGNIPFRDQGRNLLAQKCGYPENYSRVISFSVKNLESGKQSTSNRNRSDHRFCFKNHFLIL